MSQYSRYMFRRPAQHASFCPASAARMPRYRTFAERLGRRNAKSILLHYFSVIILSYIVWTIREIVYKYSLKCEYDPHPHRRRITTTMTTTTTTTTTTPPSEYEYEDEEDSGPGLDMAPYWAHFICRMSQSNNILVVLLRKYLDFTSYWVTLFVVLANTGVMMVLAKHLWRAWWIKEGEKKPALCPSKKGSDNNSNKEKEPGCVSIDMGEEAAAAIQNCIDDSFLVEVILAAFDFFRVSETKQD